MIITQTLNEIAENVKNIRSDAPCRFPEAASPGDYHRQGDIYITLLEMVPQDAEEIKVEDQLAPGTTRGSRHVLSHKNVTMYRRSKATVLDGPIFKTDTDVTIVHPDHGNLVCPPGIYSITYQRLYAEELKRVKD